MDDNDTQKIVNYDSEKPYWYDFQEVVSLEMEYSAEETISNILDVVVDYIASKDHYDDLEKYRSPQVIRSLLYAHYPCFFYEGDFPSSVKMMKFEDRALNEYKKEKILEKFEFQGPYKFEGLELEVRR